MTEEEKRAAADWVESFLKNHGLTWDALSPGQQTQVLRAMPCTIRCWRIGAPCDVLPGDPCPECGKVLPKQATFFKRLDNPLV